MFISRAQQLLIRLVAWSVISAMILLGDRFGILSWLRSGIEFFATPSVQVSQVIVDGITFPYRIVIFWENGSKQLAHLEQRLAETVIDKARLAELEAENKALQSQLELSNNTRYAMRPGKLLQTNETLRINLGGRDGMQRGMVVIDKQGILVGRLANVGAYSSELITPKSRDARTAVHVSSTDTSGIVIGNGNEAVLTEVLQGDALHINDVIITSGEDDIYPEGLPIGQVITIFGEEAAITKKAEVALAANLKEEVFVLQ